MPNQEFDLFGMAAAAKFLGCDRGTISNYIRDGRLEFGVHYSVLGREHKFSSQALTNWLKTPPAKRKVKA
jgi:excisionase family DNA binding protein